MLLAEDDSNNSPERRSSLQGGNTPHRSAGMLHLHIPLLPLASYISGSSSCSINNHHTFLSPSVGLGPKKEAPRKPIPPPAPSRSVLFTCGSCLFASEVTF